MGISAAVAGKLVEWIKLSPRYLLPLSLFTGFLLFAPAKWLFVFGLVGFVSDYRSWFGLAFLLSTALLLSAAIMAMWELAKRKWDASKLMSRWQRRLHNLSEREKDILRRYIEEETRTQYWQASDGVVGGLVDEQVLYRARNLSRMGGYFACNIQPWAWEYLNEHRKLLSEERPRSD